MSPKPMEAQDKTMNQNTGLVMVQDYSKSRDFLYKSSIYNYLLSYRFSSVSVT